MITNNFKMTGPAQRTINCTEARTEQLQGSAKTQSRELDSVTVARRVEKIHQKDIGGGGIRNGKAAVTFWLEQLSG